MTQADETIVLGAKDQASKVLERIGDNNKRLGQRVATMSRKSVAATKKVEVGFHGLKAAMGPMLAAFAAFKGVTAGFRFLGSASEAFNVQEDAVRGLTTALELNGNAAGPSIDAHKAFASQLQSLTNVGDEVTLGLMKQASTMGVSNDKLQDVTRAAIGLAEATGQPLETALRKTVEAANGSTSSLSRYLPALKSASTEAEKLAIIEKAAADGLALKADRAKSAQGAGERAANSWGDFKEIIGEVIAPVQQLAGSALATLAETMTASLIPAIEGGKGALASMKPIFDSIIAVAQNVGVVISTYIEAAMASFGALSSAIFGNAGTTETWGATITSISEKVSKVLIGLITASEVFYTNLGTVIKTAGNVVKLALIGIYENTKHAFTVQIPEVLTWFRENWRAILTDTFNASIAATKNYAANQASLLKRLWEFVASAGKGGFGKLVSDLNEISSRPLLEGFTATLEGLPEITQRAFTDTEKRLQQSIGESAGGLGEQWRTKFQERIDKLGFDAVEKAAEAADPKLPQIKAADEGVKKITDKIKEDVKIGGKVEVQALQAKESRLLSRGDSSDPASQTAEHTKQTAEGVQSLHPTLTRIGDALSAVTNGLTSQIGSVLSQFQPVDPSAMLAGIPQAIGAEVGAAQGQAIAGLQREIERQPSQDDGIRQELATIRQTLSRMHGDDRGDNSERQRQLNRLIGKGELNLVRVT